MTYPITAIIFDFGNLFLKWDPHGVYKRFLPTHEAVDSFLKEIRFMEWNSRQDTGRSFSETFPLMQKRYDFLKLFDDVIISGEHKLIKPDPAIYQLTLNRINRKTHECLFIDDSFSNIETAQKLGFHTIQFYSPEQLNKDLEIFLCQN